MSANSTIKVSRRSAIDPFIVMEVMAAANARARRGGDVLHLEVGEPVGGAPPAALEAVRTAMAHSPCGYTEAFGLPMLRHALAEQYRHQYHASVAPARIALTVGASGAFILAFLAAFDAGDRVIVTEPGYPAYRNILSALGIEVVSVPTDLSTGFQPTPELLDRVQGPIAGLVLASPSNPTGSIMSRMELARVSAWCAQRGVRIISDEIYHGITYDEPAETILAFAPDAVVVNSFSKFYGMTGWRLGWLVLPDELVAPVTRLAQNLFISAPAIAQHAALGAMSDLPELQRRLEHYRRNRALLLERLPRMGLSRMAPPDGAFYLYVDVGHLGLGSVELCRKLLDDTGVALTPGVDFDPARGDRYIRLSFAGAESDVAEAARRMEGWFGTLAPRLEQGPRLAGARA